MPYDSTHVHWFNTFERRLGQVAVDGGVGFRQILVDGMFAGPLAALGYDIDTANLHRWAGRDCCLPFDVQRRQLHAKARHVPQPASANSCFVNLSPPPFIDSTANGQLCARICVCMWQDNNSNCCGWFGLSKGLYVGFLVHTVLPQLSPSLSSRLSFSYFGPSLHLTLDFHFDFHLPSPILIPLFYLSFPSHIFPWVTLSLSDALYLVPF